MSTTTRIKTKMGAQNPYWAPVATTPEGALPTYGTARRLSELIKVTENLTQAEAKQYADNKLANTVKEFKYCDLTYDNAGFTDEDSAAIFGQDLTDGVLTRGAEDEPPYGGFSFYRVLKDGAGRFYEGVYYPYVKAALANETTDTRGENITFNGDSAVLRASQADDAKKTWKSTKVFESEADADAWAQSKVGYGSYFVVGISVSGTGNVSPVGNKMVASGGSLAITVGTPTKVYDNGADVTSAVAANKYTVANVTADHDIVVIFG